MYSLYYWILHFFCSFDTFLLYFLSKKNKYRCRYSSIVCTIQHNIPLGTRSIFWLNFQQGLYKTIVIQIFWLYALLGPPREISWAWFFLLFKNKAKNKTNFCSPPRITVGSRDDKGKNNYFCWIFHFWGYSIGI